jgi:hypothetical protein
MVAIVAVAGTDEVSERWHCLRCFRIKFFSLIRLTTLAILINIPSNTKQATPPLAHQRCMKKRASLGFSARHFARVAVRFFYADFRVNFHAHQKHFETLIFE